MPLLLSELEIDTMPYLLLRMLKLAIPIKVCNTIFMCEFNQRLAFPPRGCHDADFSVIGDYEQPTAWANRVAQLSEGEATAITAAIDSAARDGLDVEIFRYYGTKIIGIALNRSYTDSVQIFEYPPRFRGKDS